MAGIDPEEAPAYPSRWRLVLEVEVAEFRRTSSETKLRQVEALVGLRDFFGPDPNRAIEESEVRERWARLRRAFSA
jgi:hypothetical protein